MSIAATRQRVTRSYERLRRRFDHARARSPLLDHATCAAEHYGEVLGSQLAAGVTYYAFLSFFPLVALAFAIVGYAVAFVPGAEHAVMQALSGLLPGMIGTRPGQIDIDTIASSKTGVGLIGLVGLVYAGLGWISALRTAIEGVFRSVGKPSHNFVTSKLFDLLGLVVLGVGLLLTGGAATVFASFAESFAGRLGVGDVPGIGVLLRLLVLVLTVGLATVLFFATYKVLPGQSLPARPLWKGALLAASGYVVLQLLASLVLRGVTGNVVYGTFAVLVALLVWMNYGSRLAVFGAAWAVTARVVRAEVESKVDEAAGGGEAGLARTAADRADSGGSGDSDDSEDSVRGDDAEPGRGH